MKMLSDNFLQKAKTGKLPRLLRKYLVVFSMTWQEYFVWRVNFVLWRFRQILQLLLLFFFWSVATAGHDQILGYSQAAILTYILGTQLMRSIVLSSRSIDVAAEIHDGKLTNYLLKPVSYFGFWFVRDISDKFLNILFALLEVGVLVILLRPSLLIQQERGIVLLAALVSILAMVLYFLFSFLLSLLAFWVRDVWASRFLILVILEFFSGGFFPIDILPRGLFLLISATPFPYLIFFPIKIYLGQLAASQILAGLTIMGFWIVVLALGLGFVWNKGLRIYAAEGR